jgi:hypothetical protein
MPSDTSKFALLVKLNNYYVDGLYLPMTIVISEDSIYWYPLHVNASVPGIITSCVSRFGQQNSYCRG